MNNLRDRLIDRLDKLASFLTSFIFSKCNLLLEIPSEYFLSFFWAVLKFLFLFLKRISSSVSVRLFVPKFSWLALKFKNLFTCSSTKVAAPHRHFKSIKFIQSGDQNFKRHGMIACSLECRKLYTYRANGLQHAREQLVVDSLIFYCDLSQSDQSELSVSN